MNRSKRMIILSFIILSVLAFSSVTYAKYIIKRKFDVEISSAPFYFVASAPSNNIVFERTANQSDHEDILTTTTTFSLDVKNNNGTNYNSFETTYEVTVVGSNKFTFVEGDKVTKTIGGNSKIDDTITLNLKIKNLTLPDRQVKIRVTTTKPYSKTQEFTFSVEQKGAIQTIEDLVDLSLAVRKISKAAVESERYKMTRNLDFKNPSSYDDANRSDYGNVNGDSITEKTLIDEMTKAYSDTNNPGAGFLPIGMHDTTSGQYNEFKGVFNGGHYSISNLRIHKSKQSDIGLFGFTIGADIRNLTIIDGDVYNENQNAGMVVGKAQGGTIENVNVEGKSVMAVDTVHTAEDTYSGGIVGFVEHNATIKNCINRAEVTTKFTGDDTNYSGPSGGICGWMANSKIVSCTNYGTITGQRYIGGIAGFAAMQDSIIGTDGGGTVDQCGNYGKVTTYITSSTTTAGHYIGGICGYNKKKGIVSNCTNYAEATVSGIGHIGGIIGGNYGTAKNCKNYSTKISGKSSVGKLFGLNSGTQTGCEDLSGSGDIPIEPPSVESTETLTDV